MEGGLEGIGDGVFGDSEPTDASGEARPLGAFEGEEKFVDIVEAVGATAERDFDFLCDGERAKDVGDGLIEERVGDG